MLAFLYYTLFSNLQIPDEGEHYYKVLVTEADLYLCKKQNWVTVPLTTLRQTRSHHLQPWARQGNVLCSCNSANDEQSQVAALTVSIEFYWQPWAWQDHIITNHKPVEVMYSVTGSSITCSTEHRMIVLLLHQNCKGGEWHFSRDGDWPCPCQWKQHVEGVN